MSVRIDFSCDGRFRKHPLLSSRVREAVRSTLNFENIQVPCTVSVLFTDNEGIRKINREFRNVDRETDVLSFPENEFDPGSFNEDICEFDHSSGRYILGDIVISVPKCEQQGKELGHSVYKEVEYLTVHSMLHLLGYDHMDEGEMKKQMRSREKIIMGEKE
jgi:probable rRNA maturation factor